MTYRVVQWATGSVGRAAIEGVLAHPELELVGGWVHSDRTRSGATSARSAASSPIGVTATDDVDEILALDADCVVYSPMLANPPSVIAPARVGQERRHAGRLDLPVRSRTTSPRSRRRATAAASRCTARASTPAASPSGSR